MPHFDSLHRDEISFEIGLLLHPALGEFRLLRQRCVLMANDRLFSDSCHAMGTQFQIHLYADDADHAALFFEITFDEIRRIDRTLSHYQETSELTRINRSAAQQTVTTDPEVFRFLQVGFDYSRQSGGAFDMTIGPLMRLWGFFDGAMRVPSDDELKQALATVVGWHKVILDPAWRGVEFLSPGVELDPGAFGKGSESLGEKKCRNVLALAWDMRPG